MTLLEQAAYHYGMCVSQLNSAEFCNMPEKFLVDLRRNVFDAARNLKIASEQFFADRADPIADAEGRN